MAGIKGKSGRQSLRTEISVYQRLADLTPKVFKVVEEALQSKKKADRRWAAEWAKGAIVKMIPQEIGGLDGQPITVKIINYAQADDNFGQEEMSEMPTVETDNSLAQKWI